MTIEEVRKLSDVDLSSKVTELKSELFTLRIQSKAGQLDNGGIIRSTRKDIARCLTVINERKAQNAVDASK